MSSLRSAIQVEPQSLFSSSSTQLTDLGAVATTGDGRYFAYVKVGATDLVPGKAYQGPASDGTNMSPVGGIGISAAAATGANQVTLSTSLTLTANQLAGGVMSVAVTPGQGYSYKVSGNSAVTAATGATVTLEDALLTNLSTSSKVVFYYNKYNGVVVLGTTATAPVVGVAIYPVPASNFGWLQIGGIVSTLIGSTAAPGQDVGVVLANTTGALSPATGFTFFQKVGTAPATANITEYDLIDLSLN